ncbi:MAG TPA: hypothetical protein VGF59_10255 [Bryobacteraceae bacterium]
MHRRSDVWTGPRARRIVLGVLVLAAGPLLCREAAAAPTITAVLDAAAYTPDIAQGSVFVVKGASLCGPGTVYGSIPLSQSPLNNVKITFTPAAGGASTDAYMVYTYAAGALNQLAAILPSTVAPGDYNVTVTSSGAVSPAFKATVVAHKFGIITVNGSGAGRAVIQNYISSSQYDLGRYTTGTIAGFTYSPAHPGQIIVIWGTGMGPISSPDNVVPGAIDLRSSLDIRVTIDGKEYKPDLYAGRAPSLPGADEIVMTLPADVSTGCMLTMQVSVNGQLSNESLLSIAPGANAVCTEPGFSTEILTKLDQGGKFNVGALSLGGSLSTSTSRQGVTTKLRLDDAGAFFVSLNPDEITPASIGQTTAPLTSGCTVTRRILVQTTPGPVVIPQFSLLGPGQLRLTGPNVINAPISTVTLLTGNISGVTASSGAVLAGGTYTVTGPGGKDVGPFTATIQMAPPLIVTGGVGTEIDRSQPLAITWTGGGTSQVTIAGGASVQLPGSVPGNRQFDSGTFQCITTADKGSFTVPASILQQLPATSGNLTLTSNYNISNFNAPLVAGGNLDYGVFYTGFTNSFNPTYK